MNKITVMFVCLVLALGAAIMWRKRGVVEHGAVLSVGILQTAAHPALDAAREGFVVRFNEANRAKKIEYVVLNGQGSVAQLQSMAQSLKANRSLSLLYAIGTPAAQVMAQAERVRPIAVAAVTDPEAAGIVKQGNVFGSRDCVDTRFIAQSIKSIFPNAKTVGVVYSAGEINAYILVTAMERELAALGLAIVRACAHTEAELPIVLNKALQAIDVLWAPTDNMVATAATYISQRALENNVPFFVSDNELIKNGACFSCGVDYAASGSRSADMATAVLTEASTIRDVGFESHKTDDIFAQRSVVRKLGLESILENRQDIIFTDR